MKRPMTTAQVIEDDWVQALFGEQPRGVAADVPGAAGDQDAHAKSPIMFGPGCGSLSRPGRRDATENRTQKKSPRHENWHHETSPDTV